MRIDTSAVPTDLADQCKATGIHFAQLTYGVFQDAGDKRCDWTRGTFEGSSMPVWRDSELYEACEQIMDDAASEEWERLWDETACIEKYDQPETIATEFAAQMAVFERGEECRLADTVEECRAVDQC